MSVAVNVHEAKTQLSRLLDQALAGEDVISCVQGVRSSAHTGRFGPSASGSLAAAGVILSFRMTLTPVCRTRSLTLLAGENPSGQSRIPVDRRRRPAPYAAIPVVLRESGQRIVFQRSKLLGNHHQNRYQSITFSASSHRLSDEVTRYKPSRAPWHSSGPFEEVGNFAAAARRPFDRMIVAQARSESMSLLSKDKATRRYKVRIL
jgi:hypothetical protein